MKNILKSAVCVAALMVGANSATADIDTDLMAGMEARLVGPAAMSGRITAIDVIDNNPNHIVIGAATGGVWISNNGGLNWTPVFDKEECASIGAVAIDQTNPDIIWVGTGEGNVRNSTSIGCGMFKSVDGGKSWNKVGLDKTERINRIALDPRDSNVAYAAAMGKLWGANEERGLYKTTDGGKSWNKVLYVDENVGATDVQMDPSNPNKLFASMWNFRRWPYQFKSSEEGSGMYVSHDGGENWKQLTVEDGLPKGKIGRTSFQISPSNPNVVYALLEHKKSQLIRSDDGGSSWRVVNNNPQLNDRPFYYGEIRIDPNNPDVIYQVGTLVEKSIDGGKSFAPIPAINCCAAGNTIHIDNHDFWVNPQDSNHMIDGNDGGIAITRDGGETWRFVENLPLAQFYHIAVDDGMPYNIYGGLQDNGSWRGPSETFETAGIRNSDWQEVGFGDGFDTIPHPENNREGFTMSQGGFLTTWNLDTNEQRFMRPDGPADGTLLRFNWNAGLAQSPHDVNTVYYGSQFVHKSTDRGLTWEIISGDMTTNNAEQQEASRTTGGLTDDVTAAEFYNSIASINPSPVDANVIWVGTDDGRVHVTQDGGATWTSVEGNLKRGPKGAWVPMIEPDRFDASVAYIVLDDHRRGDNNPHAYKLENYGKRWRSMTDDNVSGYALSVRQDHVDPNLLFLGTEFGLHFSTNGGKDWAKWTAGVPTVSVMDMAIQERENDLVLGTHGRAVIVIDDYSGLRGLSESTFDEKLKVLSVSDGQQYSSFRNEGSRFAGNGDFAADNEPYGVMVTFMMSGDELKHPDADKEKERMVAKRAADAAKAKDAKKEDKDDAKGEGKDKKKDPKGKVTVKVADASGDIIRTFKADVHQGINRVVWGLERDGIKPALPGKAPKDGTLPGGTEVIPGDYTLTLEYGDHSETTTAKVLVDPRSQFTDADRAENYKTRLDLAKLANRQNRTLDQIMLALRDIKTLKALVRTATPEEDKEAFKDLNKQVKDVEKAFKEAEKSFRTPAKTPGITYTADKVGSKLGLAFFYVGSTEAKPSKAALAQIAVATDALNEAVESVNKLINEDLASLKSAVNEAGIGLLNQTPVSDAD